MNTQNLPVRLTTDELLMRSDELAKTIRERDETERDMKSAQGNAKRKIDKLELDIARLAEVVRRAASPVVTVAAFGLPFDRKHEAKEAGFFWDPDARVWKKTVKECDLEPLRALPFPWRETKREEP